MYKSSQVTTRFSRTDMKSNLMTLCQENKRFSDLDSSVLPHFMACASLLKKLRVILPDLASLGPSSSIIYYHYSEFASV